MIVASAEAFYSAKSHRPYPIIIGKYSYSMKKLLGEGSFGKVYEGKNDITQEKVAIKIINLRQMPKDPYYQIQLNNEIKALKSINHSNILHLCDVISQAQNCYIITEFCDGGSLKEKLIRAIPDTEALKIYSQIVDGFQALVKKNIIHRDLKPANILFHDYKCKLADFGFSRFVDDFNTSLLKSCVGSPLYMAPQILKRQKYSTKCDIWSLGVILYEMVFGRPPWIGFDEKDLLNNILSKALIFKPTVKISNLTEEILRKSLVISEENRIGWDELFKLLALKQFADDNCEDFGKTVERNRNISSFLHFVSFELFNHFDTLKGVISTENRSLEKFQFTLSFYAKKLCEKLIFSVNKMRKTQNERTQTVQILEKLNSVLKKEIGFFSTFSKDLISFFSKRAVWDFIKHDCDNYGLFANKDIEFKELRGFIIESGRNFINEYLEILQNLVEKGISGEDQEKILECLKCVDYGLDAIFIVENEKTDINFQILHEEKSLFADENVYLDIIVTKKRKYFH